LISNQQNYHFSSMKNRPISLHWRRQLWHCGLWHVPPSTSNCLIFQVT